MPLVERRGWAEKSPGNEVGQPSMCSAERKTQGTKMMPIPKIGVSGSLRMRA